MTLHRFLNLCLIGFVLVAYMALLAFGYEADKEDKAAVHSREFVAQQYCGQNSVVEWKNDVPQCLTKHGKPVKASRQVVAVIP